MVASEIKAKRGVRKLPSESDWLGGCGGGEWVMELRIEKASLPPVRQLRSPDFGSVALMPARKPSWT